MHTQKLQRLIDEISESSYCNLYAYSKDLVIMHKSYSLNMQDKGWGWFHLNTIWWIFWDILTWILCFQLWCWSIKKKVVTYGTSQGAKSVLLVFYSILWVLKLNISYQESDRSMEYFIISKKKQQVDFSRIKCGSGHSEDISCAYWECP